MVSSIKQFLSDRMQRNALLIVLCFASVLLLSSQSGASYSTYFLALAMLVTFTQWNDVFRVRLFVFVCSLIVYLILTSFWSTPFDGRELLSVVIRGLLVTMFIIAFAECQLRGQVQRWLARTMAVIGSLATLVALVMFYQEDPADGRLLGLGQLDNHVIVALVYGVVLIFVLEVLLTDRSTPWRVFSLSSVVLIVAAVYLSDSRNAWVSVILGTGTFVLAHKIADRQRFLASMVTLGFLLAVVIAALLMNDATRDLFLPRGDSHRLAIWADIISRIGDVGWLAGAGILTPDRVAIGDLVFQHPHNMYLALTFQGGLIALVAFVVLIGWMIGVLMANYTMNDAKLALGVLAVALPAYVLDGHELLDKIGETWFLFWLPVAISVGIAWSKLTVSE
ncbi:MAG: O-antigen ligase family protein [Proteobacteria bacterium]|nr:O-antigen ligase family protein [Pseudomonadota bacterium]